jgi:uncharacterized protein (UPF0179 family)
MILNREKLIQIQKEVHNCRVDLEEMQHGHVHEARKPTFKPNKNLGEGKASKLEMDYRADLITPFKTPYNKIKEILNGKGNNEQKRREIQDILQDFKRSWNYRATVNEHIYKISDTAIDKANRILKQLEKDAEKEHAFINIMEATERNKYQPDQSDILSPLLLQQYNNIEDILDSVGYDVDQAYQRCAIIQKTRPDFKCNISDYIDEAFAKAEARADGMGYFGWFKGDEVSELATMILGVGVLGHIEADWTPCEVSGDCPSDGPVCEDCWALYDENPHLIVNWPEEPHFGCRCSRSNYRLASMNN